MLSSRDYTDLPQFEGLDPAIRSFLVSSFVEVKASFGTTIVAEGDSADAIFVLASGRARVLKAGRQGREVALARLKEGDVFGFTGILVEDGLRTATVRASQQCTLYRLDRTILEAVFRQHPEIRGRFDSETGQQLVNTFIQMFTPFGKLPRRVIDEVAESMRPVSFAAGEFVVEDGDLVGPLFLVEDGQLRAWRHVAGERRYVAWIRRGDFFSETRLLRGEFRSEMDLDGDGDIDVNVEALTDCRLLALDQEVFHRLLEEHSDFRKEVEERIARRDYDRVAKVPLDFRRELLPKDGGIAPEPVAESGESGESGESAGPFERDGLFIKGKQSRRRFPFVHQLDEMDCGAACLGMICRHYGKQVGLPLIRRLLHVGVHGTSMKAIVRGAEELGLAARTAKVSVSNLDALPLPAIVHWKGNHWIVLHAIKGDTVRVADPGVGLRKLSREEFLKGWTRFAVLFDYTVAFNNAPEGGLSFRWFFPFIKPHTTLLLQTFGLALLMSGLSMVLPIFTQVIVDRVLVEHDLGLLNVLLMAMFSVTLFSIGAMLVKQYLSTWIALRIDASTLDAMTRRMLRLPLSYFNSRKTGDIQRRLSNLRSVRGFIVGNILGGSTSVIQLVTSVALMSIYSPTLLLTWLATTPFYLGSMVVSARILKPLFDNLEEAVGDYQSKQIDTIRGMEAIKAGAAESAARENLLNEFIGMGQKQFDAAFTSSVYGSGLRIISFMSMALFLYVGGRQVMSGDLTVGGLMAFNALVGMANGPLMSLLGIWDQYQLTKVMMDRLADVFETDLEQDDDGSLVRVESIEGRVQVKNLCFRFGGPESPLILDNIDLDIPAGVTVAIVGRSGSGKTTLAKCLAGLLEPSSGGILYDGVDMKTLNYRDLRRRIGFVLQRSYMFDDTIAHNIALGELEADLDQVMSAARVANAHTFIERLPLGYGARIGESGLAISGGQQQRIAIARALYRNPAILIFDEATSALDVESERAVQESLDQLLEGRTAFVIAHRLSTIRNADIILVLDEGKVAEMGSHDDLMERRGLYFYLCSQQLEI